MPASMGGFVVKSCENCHKWDKYPTGGNWGICGSDDFKTAYGKKGNPASHKTYACKFWDYRLKQGAK
jgi:hypothetical protein